MKKAIIWFISGFIAATAFSAHAEVLNMIGKQVEGVYDLTINNQKMEYQAVLIDGTTYAPVRMLGEATGYIVRFDSETGVKLVKKIVTPRATVLKSIEILNDAITRNTAGIKTQEDEMAKLLSQPQTPSTSSNIRRLQDNIENLNNDSIGCQEQIAKLNQTLLDIDAQEAELNQK